MPSDLGFVRLTAKTLVAQPHLRFEPRTCGRSIMCADTSLAARCADFRALSPIEREVATADYRRASRSILAH